MKYDVTSPAEYMKALAPDWRRTTLEELRELLRENAPELTEGIAYKMLSYHDGERLVFGLNAQKNYVSFYIGDATKVDPDGSLLEGLDRGKGCIRFKKSVLVSETKIAEFIARATEMYRKDLDIGCK